MTIFEQLSSKQNWNLLEIKIRMTVKSFRI